jgi:hypothetical protein
MPRGKEDMALDGLLFLLELLYLHKGLETIYYLYNKSIHNLM